MIHTSTLVTDGVHQTTQLECPDCGHQVDLDADEIVSIIMQCSEDTKLMDKINKITFPFTSRYKTQYGE